VQGAVLQVIEPIFEREFAAQRSRFTKVVLWLESWLQALPMG